MYALGRDKFPLFLALAALVASCLWFGKPVRVSDSVLHRSRVQVRPQSSGEVPSLPLSAARTPRVKWSAPMAKPAGDPWQFDVFSPPEIRYDEVSRQFFVTPKTVAVERRASVARAVTPGDLRLVSVHRTQFDVQLVGYAAGEKGGAGFFENVRTGENYVAVTGDRLGTSGLTLENFEIARESVLESEMRFERKIATARVRDDLSGRVTALRSGECAYADVLVAIVVLESQASTPREMREGDAISAGGKHFKVSRIQIDPAAIELITDTADNADRERLMLSLAPVKTAGTDGPTS